MSRDSNLVVKANALIDASFNLSLIEQRLMLLAIVEARELNNLTPEIPIEVKATSYMKQYRVDESNAYKQLSESSRQLFNRQFSYIDRYDDNQAVTVSRWVNEVTYVHDKGKVVLYLNRNVISMISRLEDHFTRYHLEQISDFTSQYSIRLYELIIKFLNIGNSGKYPLSELRDRLGIAVNEYCKMSDFKKRVLDAAVMEINKKTDVNINYEQFKDGRLITHILFKIKNKPIKKDVKSLKIINLSTQQINMFADKLSRNEDFQQHYMAKEGMTIEEYTIDIKSKLADSFYVNEWKKYLLDVGFVIHGRSSKETT